MNEDLTKVKEFFDKAQEVLIVTHERPTFDSIGSSLALSLGLSGIGKKVTVACLDPMTVALSSFVGVNKIASDLAKKNFIISLDYIDGSIEKVSYNIEGNKFNLVIEPRPGFEPFSPDRVHYSYAGGNADVIVSVDTIHLGGLGKLYEDNKELFAGKPIVNVDHHPNNSHYGAHNIVDPTASSTAELVAQLLSTLGAPLTLDIATNLLNATSGATSNFQNATISPGAFELAAACVKAGAKRFQKVEVSEEVPSGETVTDMPMPRPMPKVAPMQTASQGSGQAPQRAVPQSTQGQAPFPPAGGSGQAPADWLKPKIFKSSSAGQLS